MFVCLPGCGKCCGCVPLPRKLINKNRALLQRRYRRYDLEKGYIYPVTADKYCIFLHKETFECMIYDDRPEICRLFGIIPELQCNFIDMEGHKRTEEASKMISEENERNAEKRIDKFLLRMDKNHR